MRLVRTVGRNFFEKYTFFALLARMDSIAAEVGQGRTQDSNRLSITLCMEMALALIRHYSFGGAGMVALAVRAVAALCWYYAIVCLRAAGGKQLTQRHYEWLRTVVFSGLSSPGQLAYRFISVDQHNSIKYWLLDKNMARSRSELAHNKSTKSSKNRWYTQLRHLCSNVGVLIRYILVWGCRLTLQGLLTIFAQVVSFGSGHCFRRAYFALLDYGTLGLMLLCGAMEVYAVYALNMPVNYLYLAGMSLLLLARYKLLAPELVALVNWVNQALEPLSTLLHGSWVVKLNSVLECLAYSGQAWRRQLALWRIQYFSVQPDQHFFHSYILQLLLPRRFFAFVDQYHHGIYTVVHHYTNMQKIEQNALRQSVDECLDSASIDDQAVAARQKNSVAMSAVSGRLSLPLGAELIASWRVFCQDFLQIDRVIEQAVTGKVAADKPLFLKTNTAIMADETLLEPRSDAGPEFSFAQIQVKLQRVLGIFLQDNMYGFNETMWRAAEYHNAASKEQMAILNDLRAYVASQKCAEVEGGTSLLSTNLSAKIASHCVQMWQSNYQTFTGSKKDIYARTLLQVVNHLEIAAGKIAKDKMSADGVSSFFRDAFFNIGSCDLGIQYLQDWLWNMQLVLSSNSYLQRLRQCCAVHWVQQETAVISSIVDWLGRNNYLDYCVSWPKLAKVWQQLESLFQQCGQGFLLRLLRSSPSSAFHVTVCNKIKQMFSIVTDYKLVLGLQSTNLHVNHIAGVFFGRTGTVDFTQLEAKLAKIVVNSEVINFRTMGVVHSLGQQLHQALAIKEGVKDLESVLPSQILNKESDAEPLLYHAFIDFLARNQVLAAIRAELRLMGGECQAENEYDADDVVKTLALERVLYQQLDEKDWLPLDILLLYTEFVHEQQAQLTKAQLQSAVAKLSMGQATCANTKMNSSGGYGLQKHGQCSPSESCISTVAELREVYMDFHARGIADGLTFRQWRIHCAQKLLLEPKSIQAGNLRSQLLACRQWLDTLEKSTDLTDAAALSVDENCFFKFLNQPADGQEYSFSDGNLTRLINKICLPVILSLLLDAGVLYRQYANKPGFTYDLAEYLQSAGVKSDARKMSKKPNYYGCVEFSNPWRGLGYWVVANLLLTMIGMLKITGLLFRCSVILLRSLISLPLIFSPRAGHGRQVIHGFHVQDMALRSRWKDVVKESVGLCRWGYANTAYLHRQVVWIVYSPYTTTLRPAVQMSTTVLLWAVLLLQHMVQSMLRYTAILCYALVWKTPKLWFSKFSKSLHRLISQVGPRAESKYTVTTRVKRGWPQTVLPAATLLARCGWAADNRTVKGSGSGIVTANKGLFSGFSVGNALSRVCGFCG